MKCVVLLHQTKALVIDVMENCTKKLFFVYRVIGDLNNLSNVRIQAAAARTTIYVNEFV